MSHNVRKHLRLGNDAYDEAIRRFIPGYEAMLAAAAEAVAAVEPELVQDLGAGTGALSEALLERRGIGTVELLDVDSEMMGQGQQRLRRFGDRVRFTLRSYDEPFSSCDAFAASLSLHHIGTMEAKSALFARVFAALRPGGVLVNADVNMRRLALWLFGNTNTGFRIYRIVRSYAGRDIRCGFKGNVQF